MSKEKRSAEEILKSAEKAKDEANTPKMDPIGPTTRYAPTSGLWRASDLLRSNPWALPIRSLLRRSCPTSWYSGSAHLLLWVPPHPQVRCTCWWP